MTDWGRDCPACGYAGKKCLHTQHFSLSKDHPVGSQYDVVYCLRCGMMYADFPSSQEKFDSFYEKSAQPSSLPIDQNEVFSEFVRWFSTLDVAPDAAILDLGCGRGGLLLALKQAGYTNLTGLDSLTHHCREVRKAGIRCEQGSLFSNPFGEECFDLVISTHVLEHLFEVGGALSKMAGFLRPGGRLLVTVPDLERSEDMLASKALDFNYGHINFFTLHSLRTAVFTATGMGLVASHTYPQPYFQGFLGPTVCGAFSGGGEKNVSDFDPIMPHCGQSYVEASVAALHRLGENVRRCMNEREKWVIWGTTDLTARLFASEYVDKSRVLFIADNNPAHDNGDVGGVPVLHPTNPRCSVAFAPPDAESAENVGILCYYWYYEEAIMRSVRDTWRLGNPVYIVSPETIRRWD